MRSVTLFASLICAVLATGGAMAADPEGIMRIAKPGGTRQDFHQDRKECVRLARHDHFPGRYKNGFNRQMALHCLKEKGYVQDPRGFELNLPK